MKKAINLGPALLAGFLAFGCAGGPAPAPSADLRPTKDQAVVSVKRDNVSGQSGYWDIYIDNNIVGSVGNGQETRLALRNGSYFIYLATQITGAQSEVLSFKAESNEVAFTATLGKGLLGGLHLAQNLASASEIGKTGLDGAIERAGEKFIAELPEDAVIVILDVSARNRNNASLVVDDLWTQLVDSHKFTVLDRKLLDSIRAEHTYQMSGDVDDDSIVGIGGALGASIVITGSIEGSGDTQRLMLKAVDVRTTGVKSIVNERF